jgi:transcriptional regulator with GAF, ATPase, and Fis domain
MNEAFRNENQSNITHSEFDQAELKRSMPFETLVSEISAQFIGLDYSQMDEAVSDALAKISEFTGSDLSTFMQLDEKSGQIVHTHQWLRPNIDLDLDFTDLDLVTSAPWVAQELPKLEPVVVSCKADLPKEAEKERAIAESTGIKSVAWVPIAVAGSFTACIVLNAINHEQTWPGIVIRRLRLLGEIFANSLNRARSDRSVKLQAEALRNQIRFEGMLSKLSATFVALPVEEIDGRITDALRTIGEHMAVDRVFVDQFSDDKKEFRLTHMWTAPGIPRDEFVFEVVLSEYAPWFTNTIMNGQEIVFSSRDEIPEEAVFEQEYVKKVGIKSSAIVPLTVNRSVIGDVGLDMMRQEHVWSDEALTHLRLLGDVVSNALKRKESEAKIRRAYDEVRILKDRLEAENVYLKKEISGGYSQHGILGHSEAIRNVMRQAQQVASTDTTVLITGETGTGKELVATAVHDQSARSGRTLVKVNCGALPSGLIEAELFGREKGAYTGAMSKQIGRFEIADGSSIFLDEISTLPLESQTKLLRVLQEGEFERLGGSQTINVDVRVISATNQDLVKAVASGQFRDDLYYRVDVFPIEVPPLRERLDDIPVLLWAFVEEFNQKMGKKVSEISQSTIATLQAYDWPGNVRELRNATERAMILSEGRHLRVDSLKKSPGIAASNPLTLQALEKQYIEGVLKKTSWRISGKQGAAELLGLKPTTLRSRMNKLGIHRPQ